jgi:hypothetical protein
LCGQQCQILQGGSDTQEFLAFGSKDFPQRRKFQRMGKNWARSPILFILNRKGG